MVDKEELARWERLTVSIIRRAGRDDPAAFAQVVAITDEIPHLLRQAAHELVTTEPDQRPDHTAPYSWADIAAALGCTRQAAWARFRRR